MKLREDASRGSELIAYRRPDDPEMSESSYLLVPVGSPAELNEALDSALGTIVVVSKRRRLFLWEGVRIHLDEVDELGTFIEFEAVLPDAGDVATAHEKVARLRADLGIEDADLVPVGYADLLMDGPEALLHAADVAMRNAYAPYSNFPVGWCAEASALGAAITAGETAITAVAVVAEKLEYCPPCGGCRQRLAEFGDVDTPVYLGRPGGEIQRTTLGELLPGSFDKSALGAG